MVKLEFRSWERILFHQAFGYVQNEESCSGAMFHSSSQERWSVLVTASHRTLEKGNSKSHDNRKAMDAT
jgi:hypothetical protein